jgi:hypothetical protein
MTITIRPRREKINRTVIIEDNSLWFFAFRGSLYERRSTLALQLRRAISIQTDGKRLRQRRAIAPSAARLCYARDVISAIRLPTPLNLAILFRPDFARLKINLRKDRGSTHLRRPYPKLGGDFSLPASIYPNNVLRRYLSFHKMILSANTSRLCLINAGPLARINHQINDALRILAPPKSRIIKPSFSSLKTMSPHSSNFTGSAIRGTSAWDGS